MELADKEKERDEFMASALADRRELAGKYRSAKDTISSLQQEVAQVGSHNLHLDRIRQLLIYIEFTEGIKD